jgi:hypothetical protein
VENQIDLNDASETKLFLKRQNITIGKIINIWRTPMEKDNQPTKDQKKTLDTPEPGKSMTDELNSEELDKVSGGAKSKKTKFPY